MRVLLAVEMGMKNHEVISIFQHFQLSIYFVKKKKIEKIKAFK